MRYLVIFLFFTSFCLGQSNFSVKNDRITWQKVYDSSISKEEIQDILSKNSTLQAVSSTLTGDSKPYNLECDSSQAIYMRDALVFFTVIEVKEGKYRVTVKDFRLIPSSTVELWNVETTNIANNLEDWQLKNDNTFRKNKLAENSRECIDKYLSSLFEFKKAEDNW